MQSLFGNIDFKRLAANTDVRKMLVAVASNCSLLLKMLIHSKASPRCKDGLHPAALNSLTRAGAALAMECST